MVWKLNDTDPEMPSFINMPFKGILLKNSASLKGRRNYRDVERLIDVSYWMAEPLDKYSEIFQGE